MSGPLAWAGGAVGSDPPHANAMPRVATQDSVRIVGIHPPMEPDLLGTLHWNGWWGADCSAQERFFEFC